MSSKAKRVSSIVVAVVLSIALMLPGCGGGKESAVPQSGEEQAEQEQEELMTRDYLKVAGSDPVTLDPHRITDIGSHSYVGKIFSGLLRLDLLAVDKNNDGDFEDQGELMGLYTPEELKDALENKIPANIAFFHTIMARGKEMRGLFVLAPDLAKEIPDPVYNSDKTISYIFELREDAKFRNGRDVTAWDFAYSFDRAADPQTHSSTAELYLGDILGVWEMLYSREYNGERPINRVCQSVTSDEDIDKVIVDLPGVEVIDAKTLKITTKNVLPNLFWYHMTYPAAFVVDKIQVDAAPKSWTDNPNGTGPYWLEDKNVGQIILRANKNYYGFQPQIDKIVYDISGGSTLSSYENNEIDLSGVGIADIHLARDPASEFGGDYFEAVEFSTSYIGLNTKMPPFDDPYVRKAFAMSIDKDWLAEEVLMDLVKPAKGILPPGIPGYRSDFEGLSFNPQKARELLAQSKYAFTQPGYLENPEYNIELKNPDILDKDGKPVSLRIKLTISGTGSAPSVILQAAVRMWQDNLGAEVILESIDYVTFLDQIKKGQFQMFSLGWIADYPDPENFLDLKFYSKRSRANNETGFENAEFDALIEAARIEKDPQKRLALYQRAEEIAVEEVPWIVLFHGKDSMLVKSYINNFFPAPMGIEVARYMSFNKK